MLRLFKCFSFSQNDSVERRREVAIRGLVVYLRENEEDLFKEQLVGKSDT